MQLKNYNERLFYPYKEGLIWEDRYTDGVKNARNLQHRSCKISSDYIGTEHLLIGIAHEGDSAGERFKFPGLLLVLEELLSGSRNTSLFRRSELYVAPRTKRVLRWLSKKPMNSEILCRDRTSASGNTARRRRLAVRILEQLGVTEDKNSESI